MHKIKVCLKIIKQTIFWIIYFFLRNSNHWQNKIINGDDNKSDYDKSNENLKYCLYHRFSEGYLFSNFKKLSESIT